MLDDLEPAPSVAGEEAIAETPVVEPDQTEGEATEEGQPAETPDDAEKKSRNQRKKEAKERMQAALQETEAARQRAEMILQQQREAAARLPQPKQSDFATYEDYQGALSAYHMIKMTKAEDIARIEAEARHHFTQADAIRRQQEQTDDDNWASQQQEAQTRYPDFAQVALRQDVPGMITPPLAKMIKQSEVGADLAYFIGQNPELGQRISQMGAVDMARAVGRLEAQLSAPKPKTVTTAPQPIAPVRSRANPLPSVESMSMADYVAARKAGKLK